MHSENRFHTLIFGASLREQRISHQAIYKLREKDHPVSAIGLRAGIVKGVEIQTGHPIIENVHTITMYMNESRQMEHVDYLLSLKPKRIIFNPGAENPGFYRLAKARGIEVTNACTLVMLVTGEFEKSEASKLD
jgi:predicted CoA-binding protein